MVKVKGQKEEGASIGTFSNIVCHEISLTPSLILLRDGLLQLLVLPPQLLALGGDGLRGGPLLPQRRAHGRALLLDPL